MIQALAPHIDTIIAGTMSLMTLGFVGIVRLGWKMNSRISTIEARQEGLADIRNRIGNIEAILMESPYGREWKRKNGLSSPPNPGPSTTVKE